MGVKTRGKKKVTSRFVKFLSVAPNADTVRSVLRSSPNSVIKSISNAALNAMTGDVALTPKQKHLFKTHSLLFKRLVSKNLTVDQKRKSLINQKGGAFPLIPILIGTVLGSLGSHFLTGLGSKQ